MILCVCGEHAGASLCRRSRCRAPQPCHGRAKARLPATPGTTGGAPGGAEGAHPCGVSAGVSSELARREVFVKLRQHPLVRAGRRGGVGAAGATKQAPVGRCCSACACRRQKELASARLALIAARNEVRSE